MNTNLVFSTALKCLQKDPTQRRYDEIAMLQRVLQPLNFFQKLIKNNHQKQLGMCFRVMKCQHFKKGQTIFHKGDRPRSFYIILTGEVYVVDTKDPEQLQRESDDRSIEIAQMDKLMKQALERRKRRDSPSLMGYHQRIALMYGLHTDLFENESAPSDGSLLQSQELGIPRESSRRCSPRGHYKESQQSPSILDYFDLMGASVRNVEFDVPISELRGGIKLSDIDEPEKYFKDGVFQFHIVNTLSQGMAFGEGGLILHQGRSASVICSQDCNLAILSKEDYKMILQELQQEKMSIKSQMIGDCLRVPPDMISPWMTHFQKIKIQISNQLIREGELSKMIYIVKKGEIRCIRKERVASSRATIPLYREFRTTQQRPLALLRRGAMLGYGVAKFTAQVASSYASLYAASRQQLDLLFESHPELKDAFQKYDARLQMQLLQSPASKTKTALKVVPTMDGHIRSDLQDIEHGEVQYGLTITETCRNRSKLSKVIIVPQIQQSGEQILRQFDQRAMDRADKQQKARLAFLRKLQQKNPEATIPIPGVGLSIEQKIRMKLSPRSQTAKTEYSHGKHDLSKMLKQYTLERETHQESINPISINSIQRMLENASHRSFQVESGVSAKLSPTNSSEGRLPTPSFSTRMSHFRTNSTMFRSRTRVDVECAILLKRFSDHHRS